MTNRKCTGPNCDGQYSEGAVIAVCDRHLKELLGMALDRMESLTGEPKDEILADIQFKRKAN